MRTLEKIAAESRRAMQSSVEGCRRKFLHFFPRGFEDQKYFDWERGYKQQAHQRWLEALNRDAFRKLLKAGSFQEIASIATRIESRTNLLFSFEKMALRDAVREKAGAEIFDEGLFDLLFGKGLMSMRFDRWCEAIASLPRKQTRVLTHPVATVFPFIAQPAQHIFLKPNVTRTAASAYGFDFHYQPRPGWETYSSLLEFAAIIKTDLAKLRPKDLIDIQSFVWVIGSNEYN